MVIDIENENSKTSSRESFRIFESRYRRLFESVRDGILILDAETNRITDVNPSMVDFLGYTREEFLGKKLWEIGLLRDEAAGLAAFDELEKNLHMRYKDVSLTTKRGDKREVELVGNVYSEDGRRVIQYDIRDITERKQLESNSFELAAIAESSNDGIISKTFDGTILSWNKAAETIFGYTAKEIINRNISILFPPELRLQGAELLESLRRGEFLQNFETTRLRKDGSRISIALNHSPIKNSNSEVIAILKTVRDISERKQAENLLRVSETKLKHLVESGIIGIITIGSNGTILEANDIFLEMFGFSRDELLAGKLRWEDLTPPKFHIGNTRSIVELKKFGLTAPREKEYLRKDGSRLQVLAGGKKLKDSDGHIAAFMLDLTARQRAERNLRESEARYRLLFESIDEGFCLIEVLFEKSEKANDYRFLEINPAFENLTGIVAADVLDGKPISRIIPGLEKKWFEIYGRVALTGEPIRFVEKWEPMNRWFDIYAFKVGDAEARRVAVIFKDITEYRCAEEALRRCEKQFAGIVDSAMDAIITTDREHRIISFNDAAERMFGCVAAECLGKPLNRFIPERFIAARRSPREGFGQKLITRRTTGRLRAIFGLRAGGEEFPLEASISQIESDGGNFYTFILRDITERKEAELELKKLSSENESQARNFDTLLTSISDMTYTFDREGCFLYANRPVLELFGLKLEEVVGKDFFDLNCPPELTRQIRQDIKRAFDTSEPVKNEVPFPDKQGESNLYEYILNPVISADGTVDYVVGTARNITERNLAHNLMQRAEANYRNLVESSPGIVYRKNPDPPFLTTYISSGIKAFGYSPEEWYAEPAMWSGILYEADRQQAIKEFDNAVMTGQDFDIKYRILARDGSIHWCHDNGRFIVDEEGNRIGLQGIILDITESKNLEEQLRQSQKLESVGLLAGGIAHDFNNMLTAINGYSDLILLQLAEDDPIYNYIEEIRKAGMRSADLTSQLLNFSRRQVIQPMMIDLNAVISETIKMLHRLIGEDILLTTTLSPEIGLVKIDPGQLRQVIMNLVMNARDAMPQGGKLKIDTANVFLDPDYVQKHSGALSGDYVRLAVIDTGSGISLENQQHLFEPFFTTKEVGQGTGLGLATVYWIVKQSNGIIEINTREAAGTTFKIYLPKFAGQIKAVESQSKLSTLSKGNETILLVEDESMVLKLTKKVLELSGYRVISARNGIEALEICDREEYNFDLLMTDVVMPQMGGLELAEKLRARYPDLLILFASGYTNKTIARHGVIESATNFIQKPYSPEHLTIKIHEILEKAEKG